jgi:hypothetical protein
LDESFVCWLAKKNTKLLSCVRRTSREINNNNFSDDVWWVFWWLSLPQFQSHFEL